MNPTQSTTTNPVSKQSLWPTLIWLQYLWVLFPVISSFFIFLTLKAKSPTDILTAEGVSVSVNQAIVLSAIQVIVYLVLLVLSLKKKKVTLKALPILEVVLYISFAISTVLVFKLNDINMDQLVIPLLLNLVRPAIVIFVLFKNKTSYIK